MVTALWLGFATLAACWLIHLIIWRIHRPAAYPIWLPIIFLVLPLVAMALWPGLVRSFEVAWPVALSAFLLHASIASCYIVGYAGIVEYSPSAEILRAVRAKGSEGMAPEALVVPTLNEEALTGKRIRHLLHSRFAEMRAGLMVLTWRGRIVIAAFQAYRSVFGLKEDARG